MTNARLILAFGILSYNNIRDVDVPHFSVALWEVQERRRSPIPVTGKPIHDYVPLYIATHTPMQYVIVVPAPTKGRQAVTTQEDVVFFEVDALGVLERQGVLFADGNAASTQTQFYSDPLALLDFDWVSIRLPNAYPHCYDRDWKRKKSAEVLVPETVSPSLFSRIVVYNDQARQHLLDETEALREVLEEKFPNRGWGPLAKFTPVIDRSHYF